MGKEGEASKDDSEQILIRIYMKSINKGRGRPPERILSKFELEFK